ncbi:MAG: DUF4956 domain-containing protein [Myxococcota bacterium]
MSEISEILGVGAIVDWPDLAKLISRLALNLAAATVVIRLVYFRLYKSREYVFTYYLFNVITLFLCLLLRKVPAELGFALALFGVFGILRYRTEQIRNRDLTYLFIVIGLGIVNGVANKKVSAVELLLVNAVIVTMTMVLELAPLRGERESSTPMLYDRLEYLQPGREAQLLADISARTGLAVKRVQVQKIDMLRDAAEVTIYYRPSPP